MSEEEARAVPLADVMRILGGLRKSLALSDEGETLAASLHESRPWMAEASNLVWKDVTTHIGEGGAGLRFRPFILDGPPGIGKTAFARGLAREAGQGSAAFRVAGVEWGWSTSAPGVPLEAIVRSRTANPAILVDEIDKAGRGWSGNSAAADLTSALLGLLEPETARSWECCHTRLRFDMSRVCWILASNDARARRGAASSGPPEDHAHPRQRRRRVGRRSPLKGRGMAIRRAFRGNGLEAAYLATKSISMKSGRSRPDFMESSHLISAKQPPPEAAVFASIRSTSPIPGFWRSIRGAWNGAEEASDAESEEGAGISFRRGPRHSAFRGTVRLCRAEVRGADFVAHSRRSDRISRASLLRSRRDEMPIRGRIFRARPRRGTGVP
ncbi:MAG: AAA family ATPase [Albidovulum sp.]|nr:AAA family ATPase [Albidovulum sp.]